MRKNVEQRDRQADKLANKILIIYGECTFKAAWANSVFTLEFYSISF